MTLLERSSRGLALSLGAAILCVALGGCFLRRANPPANASAVTDVDKGGESSDEADPPATASAGYDLRGASRRGPVH